MNMTDERKSVNSWRCSRDVPPKELGSCGRLYSLDYRGEVFSETGLPVYGVLGSYLCGVTIIGMMRRARQRSMVYSLRDSNVA